MQERCEQTFSSKYSVDDGEILALPPFPILYNPFGYKVGNVTPRDGVRICEVAVTR